MPEEKIVINIVDQLSPVNYGIWNAAIATAEPLFKIYGVKTILVAPESEFDFPSKQYPFVELIRLKSLKKDSALAFLKKYSTKNTLVASHGAWQYPTKWGYWAKKMGFNWVYTPHGMLEPWSMSQKKLKKAIYFLLLEKRYANQATFIRAVGKPESINLLRHFKEIKLIPNGVYSSDFNSEEKPESKTNILFLARLHEKKGIIPLVNAWKYSNLYKNQNFELLIAGTDDGEKTKLDTFLIQNSEINIRFYGPKFGEEKQQLLSKSHYYILPSVSEGFPTSVLESMAACLVPIITEGCNFPEAIEQGLAILTRQNKNDLIKTLNQIAEISEPERNKTAHKCQNFIRQYYTWEIIAGKQFELIPN